MQILSGRRHLVGELAFSHCGRWLAAGGSYSGGIHVWDTADPAAPPLKPGIEPFGSTPTFRPDGRLFFVARNNEWFLYDPAAGALTRLCAAPAAGDFYPTADGLRAVRAAEHLDLQLWTIPDAGKPVRVWSVKGGKLTDPAAFAPRPGAVRLPLQLLCAAFAPGGATFATAGDWRGVGVVTVRDATSGEVRAEFASPATEIDQLAFSADGGFLLGWWGANLVCWDLAEPDEPPRQAVNPTRKRFLSMAVHPAGPLLTIADDKLVQVWDVPALAPGRAIEWNVGKLHAVAVSPDGARAAVGSHTGKVLVWDWD